MGADEFVVLEARCGVYQPAGSGFKCEDRGLFRLRYEDVLVNVELEELAVVQ